MSSPAAHLWDWTEPLAWPVCSTTVGTKIRWSQKRQSGEGAGEMGRKVPEMPFDVKSYSGKGGGRNLG